MAIYLKHGEKVMLFYQLSIIGTFGLFSSFSAFENIFSAELQRLQGVA